MVSAAACGLQVPEEEHTRWKYLAHLDGYSASYRLSMLLHANSVVLKQARHCNLP